MFNYGGGADADTYWPTRKKGKGGKPRLSRLHTLLRDQGSHGFQGNIQSPSICRGFKPPRPAPSFTFDLGWDLGLGIRRSLPFSSPSLAPSAALLFLLLISINTGQVLPVWRFFINRLSADQVDPLCWRKLALAPVRAGQRTSWAMITFSIRSLLSYQT